MITDRYGRRVGSWLYLGFVCVGIITETVARNWQTWLAAKFICGWAYGFIQGGPLSLMSEIVMPQMRGNVLACFSLNWALGTLFCSIGLQIINVVGDSSLAMTKLNSSPRLPHINTYTSSTRNGSWSFSLP